MTVLNTEARDALPDSAFALSGRRYPIPDANHARAALSRASEMFHKGHLTQSEMDEVIEKAHVVLAREHRQS